MRIALSSDEERSQEEFRLDSEKFFSSMDPVEFQNLCESLGNNFALDFPPPTSQPQHPEMKQQVPIEANFDSHTTPPHASRVAGRAIFSHLSRSSFPASHQCSKTHFSSCGISI